MSDGFDWGSLWSWGGSDNTADPAKDILGSSSIWGPLIMAGGSLANTYFAADQNKYNNDIAIQQANAQRAWAEGQQAKEIAARTEAAKIQAAALEKAAKINQMANLYQTWAQVNQRAGEAMGQSALQTGANAIGAISSRSGALR